MSRTHRTVALAVVFGLWAGLAGCQKDSAKQPSPTSTAASPPASQPATAAKLAQPDPAADKVRADLEGRLRYAEDQIAQLKKDHLAAMAKLAKDDESTLNYQQGLLKEDLNAERKRADDASTKLKNLELTLAALRERLSAAGDSDWVVRVEAEAFGPQKDVQLKQDANASGGKAVLFDKKTGTAETIVTVKPGVYRILAVGMAPGGGDHDSMNLSVKPVEGDQGAAGPEGTPAIDIQQRMSFDANFEKFCDGSSPPVLVIAREGKLKITLSATEETGFLVDRLEVRAHIPK